MKKKEKNLQLYIFFLACYLHALKLLYAKQSFLQWETINHLEKKFEDSDAWVSQLPNLRGQFF